MASLDTPLVSVIIVHYNTPELTRACVDSVIAKTQGVRYEIIVVDNASTIGDIADIAATHPAITYLRQQANLGFAGGNNAGIAAATGDYILLLNSDTELANDAITLSVSALQKLGDGVGALSCKLIYPDGRLQYPTGAFPQLSEEFAQLFRLPKLFPKRYPPTRYFGDQADYGKPFLPDWIWGAFWLAPKQAIAALPGGRLPDDFFLYYEDVLWAWELRKRGYCVAYDPAGVVIHHLSASTKPGSEQEKYRNKIFPNERAFLRKQHGLGYQILFYLVRALHLLTLRQPDSRKLAWFYLRHLL